MAIGLTHTPMLETGDNLSRDEFLRIWEQLPQVKRAELIGGVVYMPSPQRREHGSIGRLISGWLLHYQIATPGCEGGDNTTSLIGEDCPQPDHYLALLPEYGGKSWGEKYVEGAPELIVEVSFSAASIDLHQKLELYQKAGVQEYAVVVLKSEEIRWHRLVDGRYQTVPPDGQGVFRSQVFPGLWLDGPALLRLDSTNVLARLQTGIESAEHRAFVHALAARKGRG